MIDPTSVALIGATVVLTVLAAAHAALKGWQAFIDLKRLELVGHVGGDATLPPAGGRIEIADLKERVRKLEAIAAGIDL